CYFKQENKDTIHACCSKNCKYPIKHTYVVEDKIDDGSVIGSHANRATEYRFPQGFIEPFFKPFIYRVKYHSFCTTLINKKYGETYNQGMCYHDELLVF